MPNFKWSELDHLQVGQYSEYYAKMEFTSSGFDVFTSEIDDHGIDFIVKVKNGLYSEIQVKAARLDRTSYVFAKKSKFDIDNSNMFMALVLLKEDEAPLIYLIPTEAWIIENDLFRNREYEGKASVPEWGLNISKKNLYLLEEYSFVKQIEILKLK